MKDEAPLLTQAIDHNPTLTHSNQSNCQMHHPLALFIPHIDEKRSDENWVMARDGWEARGVVTTFEMIDGPVKHRISF